MHTYGNWPDKKFNQVEDAASMIGEFVARWGRIGVMQTKEKFGTVRVYCHFGIDCIHSVIWPRHCWIHKWWPYRLDLAISKLITPLINRVLAPYQIWVYRKAYSQAVNKYPHLKNEIMCCADYGELLEGVAGYKHSDYWKEYK